MYLVRELTFVSRCIERLQPHLDNCRSKCERLQAENASTEGGTCAGCITGRLPKNLIDKCSNPEQ